MSFDHADASLDADSFVAVLREKAAGPDRTAFIFLKDGEAEESKMTYAGLDKKACAIAAHLQTFKSEHDRALLLFAPGLDYIAAFFGCLYAGVIAVPAYPPHPARLERTLPKLKAIAGDAQARFALTTSTILEIGAPLFSSDPGFSKMTWIAADAVPDDAASGWQDPVPGRDDLAFLQYTSGSTGDPKGVMVSHGNLLANSEMIRSHAGTTPETIGVSWLPPYHDMGLIGAILQPIYVGFQMTFMSPSAFLQKPFRWLKAISDCRATISPGPNFAFDLCVRKVTDEQKHALDLNCWEMAFNGAEPVRPDTLKRFSAAFSRCGFRPETFYPCYGLAEATLFVAGGSKTAQPVVRSFREDRLGENHAVSAADAAGKPARFLVGCGRAPAGLEITIVDPQTRIPCSKQEIGEIWVAGPSVAKGYWDRLDVSQDIFDARLAENSEKTFLRTGDLGFIDQGELFISGRIKDLIVIRGRNHYPQDIEKTVETSYPLLRPGCTAAFSVEIDGAERLVIAAEVERRAMERRRPGLNGADHGPRSSWSDRRKETVLPEHEPNASIAFDSRKGGLAIREAVSKYHDLSVYAVLFLKVGAIPKTTSGKIQRNACRVGFLEKSLDIVEESTAAPSSSLKEKAPDRDAVFAAPPELQESVLVDYLAGTVADITRLSPSDISPDSPFSQLGLDSLMAVELQHRLETELGLTLPMTRFLDDRPIRAIAAEGVQRLSSPPEALPKFSDQADPGVFPISRNQRALWFLYQVHPESAADNIYFAGRLAPETDAAALRAAFDELIRRHPTLRTTYGVRNGQPSQIVHDAMPIPFDQVDAEALSKAEFNQLLSDTAYRPFDLTNGSVLTMTIFYRGPQDKILLMVIHHIAVDLWSLSVMLDELGRLYANEPVPPLPALSYSDFVAWQSALTSGPGGDRLFNFWKRQLKDLPDLDIPTDRPRPSVKRHHGAALHFNLDLETTTAIKAFARAHDATLYTTLLSIFALLLGRYSGQTDIPVGTLSAGRTRAGFESTVGYFINMLVIRSDLSGDPPFLVFLDRMRKTVMEALANHDYPFQLLLERLNPKRNPGRTPLFSTLFVLQHPHRLPTMAPLSIGQPGTRISLGSGLEIETVPVARQVIQFDLQLTMVETQEGLPGVFEYDTDLFNADTVARMAEHFLELIRSVIHYPNDQLSRIPMLSYGEKHRIIHEWNQTDVAYPKGETVASRFAAQAAETPNRTAVVCGSTRLSYQELNQRANKVAGALRDFAAIWVPLCPEDRVGLMSNRSEWMIVGMLGILKAGAAYVPIDPSHPSDRIRHILKDSACRLVLTDMDLVPNAVGTTPTLDMRRIEKTDSSESGPSAQPNGLAYVIYTSGTTGLPKGVAVEHRLMLDYVMTFMGTFKIGPEDLVLQQSAVTFDASIEEIFPTLCSGATLVLCEDPRNLESLLEDMVNHRVTVVSLSPGAIGYLNRRAQDLPDLRLVISGGDALKSSHINRLWKKTRIVNTYGPTETTVCTTYHSIEAIADPIPIGKPLPNRRVYILDANLNPVPLGAAGEICIGGKGVARCYLNQNDLTLQKFIANPFMPGERLYRSGDLGRFLPDGSIVFMGRNDFQVKIRGFRIELGEIEIILESHPNVRQAAVVDGPDPSEDRRLIAYIVPDADPPPDPAELRSYLRQKLPEYMIPAVIMPLDELPQNTSGKVDRSALPAPDRQRREAGETYVPPTTDTEKQIAELWAKALDLETVGIEDNFFDIGGHSLLIVSIQLRLGEILGREIPITAFFQHPTVASFARYLDIGDAGGQALVDKARDRAGLRKTAARRQKQARDKRSQS